MKSTPYAATAAGDLPHCNLRLGAALVMRPPGAFGASLGSRSPQVPPKAGPVAATRRSKATPRPRVGRPATSAAGTTRRPRRERPTSRASFAARIFCLRAACQLGRSARHRQHAGRSSMSRPRASTRSTCEGGRSEGSGDRAFLDGRLRSPFGSSQAEELNGELPHRPRGSECGGRAHLGLWMPQTGRLPTVAITCRAGSNAA